LSYTTFSYRGLKAPRAAVKAGQPVQIEAEVKNTGLVAGDDVVEVYLTQPRGFETPLRVLAGFTRVHLSPGQTTRVGFTLDPRTIGQVDAKGNRVVLPGAYMVSLGGAQPGDGAAAASTQFSVVGEASLPK
jgi:beta-glucosidase